MHTFKQNTDFLFFFLHLSIRAGLGELNLYYHNLGWVCFHLLVNMRLKKWLAAANTTLWAGKCFP